MSFLNKTLIIFLVAVFSALFLWPKKSLALIDENYYTCSYNQTNGLCTVYVSSCTGDNQPDCAIHHGNEEACVGAEENISEHDDAERRECIQPPQDNDGTSATTPTSPEVVCPISGTCTTSAQCGGSKPYCQNSGGGTCTGTCIANPGTVITKGSTQTTCNPNTGKLDPKGEGINTAIGCIPFSPTGLAKFFLGWALGIGGGIALLMIGWASIIIMTSSGDPKKVQGGKELLTAAVSGLLLMIFSTFILRFFGITLFEIF